MRTQVLTQQTEKPGTLYKIGNVTIAVPYRKPGNVIEHILTPFDVYQTGAELTAFPVMSEAEKRLTNLPASIRIRIKDGNVSNRRYKYIASAVFQKLKENSVVKNLSGRISNKQ